jgi:hypothetical protein
MKNGFTERDANQVSISRMPPYIASPSKPAPERVWTVYKHKLTAEEEKKERVWTQVEQEYMHLKNSGKIAEAETFSKTIFDRVEELMKS